MVEVLRDVSFRIVPFKDSDADAMIAEIRGAKVLRGVRGKKPADTIAIRKLLVQISDLVSRRREIDEMDLNPVIVHERGLTIVDSRVVLGGFSTG
jgi:acyl-CoA synthetase (NDP forming)